MTTARNIGAHQRLGGLARVEVLAAVSDKTGLMRRWGIPRFGGCEIPSATSTARAEANLEAVDAAPTSEDPAECVADKGYHSRAVLRALNDSPWKTRIAAPKQTGFTLAR